MTSNARGSGRILGILRSADGKGVVRIQDHFDTHIDGLWSALTDPGRLARWLGEIDGDLRLGGEFRFRYFASGSEGTGRVDACEPHGVFGPAGTGRPDARLACGRGGQGLVTG